jgi:hypothetical protein
VLRARNAGDSTPRQVKRQADSTVSYRNRVKRFLEGKVESGVISEGGRRIAPEWINYSDAIQILVRLQIFRQEVSARGRLGCGHNQSIPEGQLIPVLNRPTSLEHPDVHDYGSPGKQVADLGASLRARLGPLPGDLHVKAEPNS